MASLVAFFAHPDDEAFSCAGTLAAAADRSIEIAVVCATRGEAGRARDGFAGDLAERRSAELAASCAAIGAPEPIHLDLPDGRLEEHRSALVERLAPHLRDVEAVITFGPDGVYGHRDHIACTEALAEADSGATILHTVFPEGLFTELRRRLRRFPVPLVPPTDDDRRVDYVVDIGPFESRKLASIAAHRSQLGDGDPRSFLIPGLVEPLLREESYRHASGSELTGTLAELFGRR